MRSAATAVALLVMVTGVATASTFARRPAPAVTGVALDGKRVSLAAMRGKPVFINVWSSW